LIDWDSEIDSLSIHSRYEWFNVTMAQMIKLAAITRVSGTRDSTKAKDKIPRNTIVKPPKVAGQ
jgi:hypothetical protein